MFIFPQGLLVDDGIEIGLLPYIEDLSHPMISVLRGITLLQDNFTAVSHHGEQGTTLDRHQIGYFGDD